MLKTVVLIFFVSLLTLTSQTFLKNGLLKFGGVKVNNLSDFSGSFLQLIQEKYIIFGFFIAIVAAFLWLIIISKNELTLAFPISGGIFYILLFLFSWIFLKEDITILKITGTSLILIGISLVLK
jgi:multidrug transporter EmrE-like cation transporter